MIDLEVTNLDKLLFRCEQYPHLTIHLTKTGVDVNVTLNIEPTMRKFLKDNSYKADCMWVYRLHKKVGTLAEILPTYKLLLTRAMINCREAKKKVLNKEIEQLRMEM